MQALRRTRGAELPILGHLSYLSSNRRQGGFGEKYMPSLGMDILKAPRLFLYNGTLSSHSILAYRRRLRVGRVRIG